MAKKQEEKLGEVVKEVEQAAEPKSESSREKAWAAHVEKYIASNPVKGAAKKERGEFKNIPATFMA